ncbi:MAG: type II toxin-antitoxin system PemK/MazF family toxin [Anaerolineae bacterium]|nr:type II toxin-antitoxin system PemK/MazF family toxin [Anaerolineae bacterium]
MALEQFLAQYQAGPSSPTPIIDGQRIIHQGDIYWVGLDGSQAEIRHPYVVIQEDVLNHSRLSTVVVCALTSNLHRASLPGNVLLDTNEGNLPKASVIEVSKVSTLEKTHLGEYIGSLSEERIGQILAGMRFLQASFFPRS